MYNKAALSLAVLTVARLALANPYCLLTAVNKFEHPADQKTLCCKEADKVKSYLEELCPSATIDEAKDAFKTACEQAGYDDCSKDDDSSSTSSGTSTKKHQSTSAPYPSGSGSTYVSGASTGFVTGTAPSPTGTGVSPGGNGGAGAPGTGATGSPISPATPEDTGAAPGGERFTGAASRNMGSVAVALLAVAGVAAAL